ncbi:MAG: sterol carrier family protein [Bifidobacteriaceae bacterium]|jgi:hypothetical protein|nr:sterol carrier family protein [Bifidobacteriaceae bacterium]
MANRRRIAEDQGQAALALWRQRGMEADRASQATAVRYTLEELTALAPGNAVEVRVPPFGATQCIEGPRHTRGTPPNVVEMAPDSWLGLATGQLSWADAVAAGRLQASGSRADLSDFLPLPAALT